MGRHKKIIGTEIVQTTENEYALPIEQLVLTDAQIATFKRSEKKLAGATAMIGRIEKEERALKSKIDASSDMQQLKELKRKKRIMKEIEAEASAAYNGVMEFALSEFEGNSLYEKVRSFKNGNTNQLTA